MKACVLGYGSIGRRHALNLSLLGHEVGFLRSGKSKMETSIQEHGWLEFFSPDDCLSWGPEFLVVCTPTSLHLKGVNFGIRHGLHVYVEKPIACTPSEIEELVFIAQQNDLVLRAGYQMRFHELVKRAKRLTSGSSDHGALQGFSFEWFSNVRHWHPWEDVSSSYVTRPELGGGAINTLSHEIDLIQFLFGAVDSLDANLIYGEFEAIEIGMDALIQTKSGVSGVVQLRMDTEYRHRMVSLAFTESLVEIDLERGQIISSGFVEKVGDAQSLHEAAYLSSLQSFIADIEGERWEEGKAEEIVATELMLSDLRLSGLQKSKIQLSSMEDGQRLDLS